MCIIFCRLRIVDAKLSDTGNYSCMPTTAGEGDSVMVHVINGKFLFLNCPQRHMVCDINSVFCKFSCKKWNSSSVWMNLKKKVSVLHFSWFDFSKIEIWN